MWQLSLTKTPSLPFLLHWEEKGKIELCNACKATKDCTQEKDVDFHTGQLPGEFNINTIP